METDPAKAAEYTENANKYLAQALELRKKQQEEAKAAPTAAPEPGH
jgi:ABC-type Zn uptake system ZnuABC Zn-binding protein ZnuA